MAAASCCCCFSLRRGSVAIAITQLVLYTLYFLVMLITLLAVWNGPNGDVYTGILLGNLVFQAINVAFNILLLYGAQKNRRGMLLAWIIYQGVVCSVVSLFCLGYFLAAGLNDALPEVVLTQTGGVIMVPMWYWFAVVIRLYRELPGEPSSVCCRELDESV